MNTFTVYNTATGRYQQVVLASDAQKIANERDALAAHVDRLSESLEDITQAAQQEGLQFSGWQEPVDKAVAALLSSPATSLAQRDAQVRKAFLGALIEACAEAGLPEFSRTLEQVLENLDQHPKAV